MDKVKKLMLPQKQNHICILSVALSSFLMLQDPSISKSKCYYFYSFLLNNFPFKKSTNNSLKYKSWYIKTHTWMPVLVCVCVHVCVCVCVYKCFEAFQQYPETSVNDVRLFSLILCKRRCIPEMDITVHHRYFALQRSYLKRDGLFLGEKRV